MIQAAWAGNSGALTLIGRSAPGCIHTDGEVHETDANIEVVVRPRSLRVMVPEWQASIAGLLAITLIGIPAAILVILIAGLWVLYRVVRGWLVLLDRKAIA